jgi:hypothetical protein
LLWNGTKWTRLPSPNQANATESKLLDVTCSTAKTCFAVGVAGFDFGLRTETLVERWNGTTWSIVASPNPDPSDGGDNDLVGVACASSPKPCFAVGASANPSVPSVIERWNGTQWSVAAHP